MLLERVKGLREGVRTEKEWWVGGRLCRAVGEPWAVWGSGVGQELWARVFLRGLWGCGNL